MKLELRTMLINNIIVPKGIVCIATKKESLLLDKIFGTKVRKDGLISTRKATRRLSDGYGEDYIFIKNK